MKNKEKPKQKQKDFTTSPFKALKKVSLPSEPAAKATPAKPKPAAPPEDDDLLFLNAFADVRRLHAPSSAPVKEKPKTPAPSRDEEDVKDFLRAVDALKMDVRFTEELPEDTSPRPIPVNRLRQLRRGTIRADLELDLHGLSRDEAIENLERFVRGAYGRGQKAVLVITGKGNNSPGEPVLRQAVGGWLRQSAKTMVSEFIPAPRDMGGSGAFVVFLKEKKAEPESGKE